MKNLLWLGDACVSSGFARCTHEILETVRHSFNVTVVGINYHGDPHEYPYPVYPARSSSDPIGIGRIRSIALETKADVIVIQLDPWCFPAFFTQLEGLDIPIIGAVAVDGKNCSGDALSGLAHAIFWTGFGATEAKAGGYDGPSSVVPLGVDTKIYYPRDRDSIRQRFISKTLEKFGLPQESFIVGVVGRNQPRKRLDLTVRCFSEFVHDYKVQDAVLWCQVAPTGEEAYDLAGLAKYYDVAGRVLVPMVNPVHGVTEELLAQIYSMFHVLMSTTQGEGWGLPALEAMACGVTCLLPGWSGYGDWARDAAILVPCCDTAVTMRSDTTVIGGIVDTKAMAAQLYALYNSKALQDTYSSKGFHFARRPQLRWKAIGEQYVDVIQSVIVEQLQQTQQTRQKGADAVAV